MNCEKQVFFDTQNKKLTFRNNDGQCVELQIVGQKGEDGRHGRNGTMFAGTTNFITKFVSPTAIGNSSLFDDGNIGYGTITPNSVAAFDIVSTTKGMLFPRMTTVQRDAIVTGPTTDGLFIYNISTEKFNFWNDTLGIWETIDTSTGGDVSGSGTTNFIPRWTDGPNSVLGDSIIRDNGTVAAVNRAIIAGTTLSVQGADAGAVNFTFQTYNSTPTMTFGVRNDGFVGIGTLAPQGKLHVQHDEDAFSTTGYFRNSNGGVNAVTSVFLSDGTASMVLYKLGPATNGQASYGGIGDYGIASGQDASVGHFNIINPNAGKRMDVYVGDFIPAFLGRPSMTIGAGVGVNGVGINMDPALVDAKIHVRGATADNTAFAMKLQNSTPAILMSVRNDGRISMPLLQVGDAGLASGDLYVDTEANVTANGDLFVARKV